MDGHLSLAYMEAEANALDLEASRIEAALERGASPDAEARACIDRAEGRLRALQDIDQHTIGAVIREHIADAGPTPWGEEWQAMQAARADRERLRRDIAAGSDCRDDLHAYARHLHAAATIERDHVAPWARRELGDALLREADARLREYGHTSPDVAVDWGRIAA